MGPADLQMSAVLFCPQRASPGLAGHAGHVISARTRRALPCRAQLLVKPGRGPEHTVGGVEQGGFLLVVLGGILNRADMIAPSTEVVNDISPHR